MQEEVRAEVQEDAGEWYRDALTGEARRKRGKRRKKPRGQYSLAEKNMVRAFQSMMAKMHYCDGELADLSAKAFTGWFTVARQLFGEFSFDNMPDPDPEDWHELAEQLGMARRPQDVRVKVVNEFDVGLLK